MEYFIYFTGENILRENNVPITCKKGEISNNSCTTQDLRGNHNVFIILSPRKRYDSRIIKGIYWIYLAWQNASLLLPCSESRQDY